MASNELASTQIRRYLLDHALTAEEWGPEIGVSGMTVRRALDGKPLNDKTMWKIARGLGEDPSTLWPITRRRKNRKPRRRSNCDTQQTVAA